MQETTYTQTFTGVDLSGGASVLIGMIGNKNAIANESIGFSNNNGNTISITAVPEPYSTALLGLVGLGFLIRRRR